MISKIGRRPRAFTLIELLVVVAIIALLIAILLPSLASAKRIAQTAACAANLHAISQVMNVYASEWDGMILGSGNTSARFMYNAAFTGPSLTVSNTNCANVLGDFDWMCPTLQSMGTYFDSGPSLTSRLSRFNMAINFKMFKCPSSNLLGSVYNSDGMTLPSVVLNPSYCTAVLFEYNGTNSGVKYQTYTDDVTLPSAYQPKLSLVGMPATKIFIADGAKFSDSKTQPDLNMSYNASDIATSWSDEGAYTISQSSIGTHCWDRGLAPGNANPNGGTIDARIYAYRHGGSTQKAPSGTFKMNAGFFDGHAELITDKDSANPALWSPSGTTMNSSSDPQTDTLNTYFVGGNYTSP